MTGVVIGESAGWDLPAVEALAPLEPGDYVLQVKAQISRDPWRRGGVPWSWWTVVRSPGPCTPASVSRSLAGVRATLFA